MPADTQDADYEALLAEEGVAKPNLTPQEKYPDVSEEEAELLGLLDDAIDKADDLDFTLPLLPVGSIAKGLPEDIMGLIAALQIPLASFVSTLGIAAVFIAVNNPIVYAIYPYVACIINFLGAVPSLKKRFGISINIILSKIYTIGKQVDLEIDAVCDGALKVLTSIDSGIESVIAPIKEKLDQATKVEKMLQKINPDIDIPDATDIEEELSEASDKIISVITRVKDSINLNDVIPKAIQSKPMFDQFVVYPFLAVSLLTQLIQTYLAIQSNNQDDAGNGNSVGPASVNMTYVDVTDFSDVTHVTTFADSISRVLLDTSLNSNSTSQTSFIDEVELQWHLVVLAFNSFIVAVVQIFICFFSTQKTLIYVMINKQILKIVGKTKAKLKEAAKPVFHDVFFVSLNFIKKQLLALIKKVERIEGPMSKIPKVEAPRIFKSFGF